MVATGQQAGAVLNKPTCAEHSTHQYRWPHAELQEGL